MGERDSGADNAGQKCTGTRHFHPARSQPPRRRADGEDMQFPAIPAVIRLGALAALLLCAPSTSSAPASPQDRPAAHPDLGALGAAAAPRESWEGVSLRLANSLVNAELRAGEEPLFLPRAEVRRFGSSELATPAALGDRFDGWRVLAVEAFEYPSVRIAADVADGLARVRDRDPQAVPEVLVRALSAPPGAQQAAEQTASRWLASTLKPSQGDQVAIVLLWNPADASRPPFERLTFLLVKAGRLPDGRYRVASVFFGTAQQAVLEGF